MGFRCTGVEIPPILMQIPPIIGKIDTTMYQCPFSYSRLVDFNENGPKTIQRTPTPPRPPGRAAGRPTILVYHWYIIGIGLALYWRSYDSRLHAVSTTTATPSPTTHDHDCVKFLNKLTRIERETER